MATTIPPTPAETTQPSTLDLSARFPGIVTADTRPSYMGWIIPKENLVEVATVIRLVHGRRADGPMRSLASELSRMALVDRMASCCRPLKGRQRGCLG